MVAQKVVQELLADGKWYKALKAQLKFNEWLFDLSQLEQAPVTTQVQRMGVPAEETNVSRHSSLDDRHVPPIVGRSRLFSESKNVDFGSRVYDMRIRTDDYAYRRDAIEHAANCYNSNKTKAVVSACDDVPTFV